MRILNFAAFILFTIFCVIVAVANRTAISFSLHPLPFKWEMPLYMLLFIGIFIGLAAGALVVTGKTVKHATENRSNNKKIRELETQVQELSPKEPQLTEGQSDQNKEAG